MRMGADTESFPQVTVTLPVPVGLVPVLIFQLHETTPSSPAVFGVSPAEVLTLPDGCLYKIVHCSPGDVCTITDAVPPSGAPTTVSFLEFSTAAVGGSSTGVPVSAGSFAGSSICVVVVASPERVLLQPPAVAIIASDNIANSGSRKPDFTYRLRGSQMPHPIRCRRAASRPRSFVNTLPQRTATCRENRFSGDIMS